MPLPWKKSRVTRISRLVADLQSSPRRGGSLVVETGFPTSLVDLIVKNRDRLRKSSRRREAEQEPELQISGPILTSPLPAHLVVDPDSIDDDPLPPTAEAPADEGRWVVAVAGRGTAGDEIDGDCVGGGSRANRVFAVFFKVFVVVVLALSTKGLVIGVTMSAFLLLFLEFVGKRVIRFLRPCPDARTGYKGLTGRVCAILSSVCPQKCLMGRWAVISCDPAEPTWEAVEPRNSSSAVEEIPVVESKFDRVVVPVESNSILVPDGESVNRDPICRFGDTAGEVRVVEEGEKDGRAGLGIDDRKQSRKIKSKIIKRIVPKRLRTSKKGKKKDCEFDPDASNTLASYLGDCRTRAGPAGEAEEECGEQGEDADKSCSMSKAGVQDCQRAKCSNKGRYQLFTGETNLTSAKNSRACPESETGAENTRSEKKRRMVVVVVLLVVLAGLLGGRFLAFVLTFGCAVTISIWASRRSFCSAKK